MASSNPPINQPHLHNPLRNVLSQRVLLIALVVVLGGAVYVITATMKVRSSTIPIAINAFAHDADISVEQIGSEAKIVGTGKTNIRLGPGTYQITAASKHSATSKVIEVTNKSGAVFSLEGEQFVPIQRLANYAAQDLFAGTDNNLYFLNKAAGIPYIYPFGNTAARPYTGTLSNVRSMQWIAPQQVVSESNTGNWSYTTGMQTTPITFNEKTPDNLSINNEGVVAVIGADKTIGRADTITSPLQPIGRVKHTSAKVRTAPDGSILIFTPQPTSSDPTEPTRLYQNGQFTELPSKLTGISNVAWSTDSQTISYTTNKGTFTYNLATKKSTQITTGTPTDPRSMLWLSPTTLVYAEDGGIWRYNIDSNASIKLGDLQGELGVQTPFTLSPDHSTLYFSTFERGNQRKGAIYSLIPNYRKESDAEQKKRDEQLKKQSENPVTYVGIATLQDIGLTPDQVQSVKYAFSQFKETSKAGTEAIRLYDFKVQLKRGPVDTITFKVDINGNYIYNGRLDTQDISYIRLFLSNPNTNQQVFDSQPIRTQQ